MEENNEDKSRERNRTIGKKVFGDKDEISLDDVFKMMEKRQLNKRVSLGSAQEYFKQIDKDNKGIIKSEEFIKLLDLKEGEADWVSEFFNQITTEMTSKSEIIIRKLKEIKENPKLKEESRTLDDLDW